MAAEEPGDLVFVLRRDDGTSTVDEHAARAQCGHRLPADDRSDWPATDRSDWPAPDRSDWPATDRSVSSITDIREYNQ